MSKQPIVDDPDSPRGNIVEDFKYFFKEAIIDSYDIKRHPIMAIVMYILSIIVIVLIAKIIYNIIYNPIF